MSFELPQVKTQGKLSFVFSGIRSWNSLPDSLKSIDSRDSFKRECKKFYKAEMRKDELSDFVN